MSDGTEGLALAVLKCQHDKRGSGAAESIGDAQQLAIERIKEQCEDCRRTGASVSGVRA